jgi:hypothetical protein
MMDLRTMLNKYGIRNDIMEALERKDTEAKEALIHEKATAMTKMMLNEVLRERKQFEQNQKAVKEPRKIIVDDKG